MIYAILTKILYVLLDLAVTSNFTIRVHMIAEVQRIETQSTVESLRERGGAASTYTEHPEMLRLEELQTLRELARTANARIYINLDQFAGTGLNKGND